MDTNNSKPQNIKEHLDAIIYELQRGLVERDQECRLLVLATFCGEHAILFGEPGVGKSMLCSRISKWLDTTQRPFERLLTKFTLPEELFGPLSLRKLKMDKHYRLTVGYLPRASIAFLDEIFKSNSFILNTLLTILQERKFDNGTSREDVPLLMMVAASNEYPPETGELQALYDRFLFRMWVDDIKSEAEFRSLMEATSQEQDPIKIPQAWRLNLNIAEEVQQQASAVEITSDITKVLFQIHEQLLDSSIHLRFSPRRWVKIFKVLKMAALTNGRGFVHAVDLLLLQHVTWMTHLQQPKIKEVILGFIKMMILDKQNNIHEIAAKYLVNHLWLSWKEKRDVLETLSPTNLSRYLSQLQQAEHTTTTEAAQRLKDALAKEPRVSDNNNATAKSGITLSIVVDDDEDQIYQVVVENEDTVQALKNKVMKKANLASEVALQLDVEEHHIHSFTEDTTLYVYQKND